jgi:hypothetical protein
MVRVTELADAGTELAVLEVDDVTIEVISTRAADMLRQARQRRQRVLSRIRA